MPGSRAKQLLTRARIEIPSGTAGAFTKVVALPHAPGGRDAEFVTYAVAIWDQSNADQVRFKLRLDHGPDGLTATTHTTEVIPSTLPDGQSAAFGDSDHDVMLGEWLHPVLSLATVDGAAQWAVVDVWELRHAFPLSNTHSRHRKLVGPVRISAGAAGSTFGIQGPVGEDGHLVRSIQYAVSVLEVTGGSPAKLGFAIGHSMNKDSGSAHTVHPVQTVQEGDLVLGCGSAADAHDTRHPAHAARGVTFFA